MVGVGWTLDHFDWVKQNLLSLTIKLRSTNNNILFLSGCLDFSVQQCNLYQKGTIDLLYVYMKDGGGGNTVKEI